MLIIAQGLIVGGVVMCWEVDRDAGLSVKMERERKKEREREKKVAI